MHYLSKELSKRKGNTHDISDIFVVGIFWEKEIFFNNLRAMAFFRYYVKRKNLLMNFRSQLSNQSSYTLYYKCILCYIRVTIIHHSISRFCITFQWKCRKGKGNTHDISDIFVVWIFWEKEILSNKLRAMFFLYYVIRNKPWKNFRCHFTIQFSYTLYHMWIVCNIRVTTIHHSNVVIKISEKKTIRKSNYYY